MNLHTSVDFEVDQAKMLDVKFSILENSKGSSKFYGNLQKLYMHSKNIRSS